MTRGPSSVWLNAAGPWEISILFIYVVPTGLMRLPLAIWIGPFQQGDKIPDYVVTLPDLVGYFYDKKTKALSTIVPIFSVLYSAALLFAVGDVLHMVSGLPIYATVVIAGVGIIFYTAMAGLWALAVTDMIQFAVMTIAAGALGLGLLLHFGGLQPVYDSIAATDPVLLTPLGHNSALDVVAWVIGAAALYVNAQSYQRFGAAKGGGEIKVAYSVMLGIGISFSAIMVSRRYGSICHVPRSRDHLPGILGRCIHRFAHRFERALCSRPGSGCHVHLQRRYFNQCRYFGKGCVQRFNKAEYEGCGSAQIRAG